MVFLSIEERIKIVDYSRVHGVAEAARTFKVSDRTVKRYRAAYEEMKQFGKPKHKRMIHVEEKEAEKTLMEYVREKRQKNFAVNGSALASQIALFNPHIQDFYWLRRWIYRTLRKNNFVSRARTHVGQALPENYADLHSRFIADFQTLLESHNPEVIINMDETPVCFDNSYRRTFSSRGSKTIAILASKAAGKKRNLRPFCHSKR